MSHTSTVDDVPYTSVLLLQQAVTALQKQGVNCSLVQDVTPRMWYQDQFQKAQGRDVADYVLSLPDCRFDVGFIKKDGKLVPVFDAHAGHIAKLLGNRQYAGFDETNHAHHLRALTAEYELAMMKKVIFDNGYTVTSPAKRESDGRITIRCSK